MPAHDPAPLCPSAPAGFPALAPARVHEVQGQGRRAFALFQAARHPAALIWILPAHAAHRPMPAGLPAGVAERLMLLCPQNETDLLWALEESLRAGCAGLVIAEPEKALSLTAGRRLQLAAEAGRTTGLILLGKAEGSNAAETRWQCEPQAGAGADSTLHHWSRIKNKKGTCGSWSLNWNGASDAVDMVYATGEREQPAPSPG